MDVCTIVTHCPKNFLISSRVSIVLFFSTVRYFSFSEDSVFEQLLSPLTVFVKIFGRPSYGGVEISWVKDQGDDEVYDEEWIFL